MSPPPAFEALSVTELKALVVALLSRIAELERSVVDLRDEVARLKKVPPRPTIKPSGMDSVTQPKPTGGERKARRGRGSKTAQRAIHEDRVIKVTNRKISGGPRSDLGREIA